MERELEHKERERERAQDRSREEGQRWGGGKERAAGGEKGKEKEAAFARVAADSLDGARVKVYAPGRYLCIRRGVTTSH